MNALIACAKGVFLFCPLLVFASVEENNSVLLNTSSGAQSGKVIIFLLAIIGMILLLAWLANKLRGNQWVKQGGHINTLAVLPMGIKEKIAVIEVGEEQIVVGITPQQITHLTTLKEKIQVSDQQSASFSEVLKAAVQR